MKLLFVGERERSLIDRHLVNGKPLAVKVTGYSVGFDPCRFGDQIGGEAEVHWIDVLKADYQMKLTDRHVDWTTSLERDDPISRQVGDHIAAVAGDTFIEHDDMTPASQWARIVRILRMHGIDLSRFVPMAASAESQEVGG